MTFIKTGYKQGWLEITDDTLNIPRTYTALCHGCNKYCQMTPNEIHRGTTHCGCRTISEVYFIRAHITDEHDYVKIGRTYSQVNARLAVTQTHFPTKVKLVRVLEGPAGLERTIHSYFQRFRIHPKREWFWFMKEMLTITLEEMTRGKTTP